MYRKRNEKTIEKAFTGLAHNSHQIILKGMGRLLQDAVMFIYEQHQVEGHTNHLEYGDTYGWALYYNGQLIEKHINKGPEISDFSVSGELESRISASDGFVGIIMAGMNPRLFFWEKHERPYMETTAAMIAAEYLRYFQK